MLKQVLLFSYLMIITALLSSCKKNYNPCMIFIEGGTFHMGSMDIEADNDERPVIEVTINSFYIGKYEITQSEWMSLMGKNPSFFKKNDCPVECVSWYEVEEFINKLNTKTGKKYRLPTEAEWEYAARGGKYSKRFKFSGNNDIHAVAWFKINSYGQTHPVGLKEPNELGIYDMTGNVHEWCNGWYDSTYHVLNPNINPQGSDSGNFRIFRGGSWYSDKKYCRVANRNYNSPDIKNFSLGFRLAESVD